MRAIFSSRSLWGFVILGTLFLLAATGAVAGEEWFSYLPGVQRIEPAIAAEFRGLWVTRFDWTQYGQPAEPERIDEIMAQAEAAGFNAVFFQVRGAADAYYTPGLEPWAQRVSGVALGQPPDPLWDPLAYAVDQAHAHNLQLHAYLNTYPVWDNCTTVPPHTTPEHLYHLIVAEYGTVDGKPAGLQWDTSGEIHCSVYQRATPTAALVNDHLLAVITDIVTRYAVDGIHLDHTRYGGSDASCDPLSETAFGAPCFSDPAYPDWQRQQINQFMTRVYSETRQLDPDLWITATAWPIYIDQWEWGGSQGYSDYYQDSKGWLAAGSVDAITPMIYPGTYPCPYTGFWSQERWEILTADFQADRAGRYVFPGIGTGYCTFDEIAARIDLARQLGTAGQALFSYTGLAAGDYFDDLAAGPYREPAVPPPQPGRRP
jgi:uncharacterized lipoprotein YddW (UPF0748 family)